MTAARIGRHIDYSSPRGYYLDYSEWVGWAGEIDGGSEDGAGRAGPDADVSPLVLARDALGSLEVYLGGGRIDHRDRFEALSRWLVESQEIVPGSFGGWAMPEVPRALRGQLASGWFSGSTHAECVAVLVRAAMLLKLEGAADAARRAFGGFRAGLEDGGFLREIGEEGHDAGPESLAFIEEYALPDRPAMILDTHARGLWAIHDFLRLGDDRAAESLFRRCVRGLVFVLDRYDLGYWTRGDLDPSRRSVCPSTLEGIATHVVMLDVLERMSGDQELGRASERWRAYMGSHRGRARAWAGRVLSGLAGAPGATIPR